MPLLRLLFSPSSYKHSLRPGFKIVLLDGRQNVMDFAFLHKIIAVWKGPYVANQIVGLALTIPAPPLNPRLV